MVRIGLDQKCGLLGCFFITLHIESLNNNLQFKFFVIFAVSLRHTVQTVKLSASTILTIPTFFQPPFAAFFFYVHSDLQSGLHEYKDF